MSDQNAASGLQPSVAFGGPTSATWREDALTKAEELDGLHKWLLGKNAAASADQPLADSIRRHLDAARRTAANRDKDHDRAGALIAKIKGSPVERTLGNLDAVEADLLRLAPLEYVQGQLPSLQAHIQRFLPKGDPRRLEMEVITSTPGSGIGDIQRGALVAAYHAANSQRRRELIRVRSFRNVILMTSAALMLIAVALAILGVTRPDVLALCFEPGDATVCPTGDHPTSSDIWLIEAVGLVAASVCSAVSVRNIRGTSTPYSLPVALALLKLPTGALTAILGLLLMRGEFVPGLSALDSTAQIISWAVVFGSSQQLFTRLIDQQASSVLQDVGGRGAAGDRPTSVETPSA